MNLHCSLIIVSDPLQGKHKHIIDAPTQQNKPEPNQNKTKPCHLIS